ncbi:MAG: hypothetical protein IJ087_19430 [Eggerthellaceae bacterium]|nr:hypothetical protein [Eggerthellaceae bacterium]
MRKPKLTYKMVEQAIEMKSHGLSNADICRGLGVSETAWYKWLKDPDTNPKVALVEGLKKSEAQYKEELLSRVMGASEKPQHWTAAAWLLERRYPDEFGRAERTREDKADEVPKITLGVEVRVAGGDADGDD